MPKDEYDALRMERDRYKTNYNWLIDRFVPSRRLPFRYYRELTLMRDTMKEFEVQIETQRQTLLSRDDSIKKLLDMLQSKGNWITIGSAAQNKSSYPSGFLLSLRNSSLQCRSRPNGTGRQSDSSHRVRESLSTSRKYCSTQTARCSLTARGKLRA